MNRVNTQVRRSVLAASAALILIFVLAAQPGVSAQNGGIELADLRISIWPEYDHPSVLVIYDGTLDPKVQLPQTLRVPVPDGADVNAVAFPGETGGLFSLAWTSEPGPQGQVLTFEVNSPQFVVEYYLDVISPPPDRSFALSLGIPYDTAQASLLLRQPTGASNLVTVPELSAAGADALGNPQYGGSLGPVDDGQAIDLSVSYTKADETPSVSGSALVPPGSEVTVDGVTPDWLPWLIGGLLLGLLVVAVVVLVRGLGRRRTDRGPRQARRKRARDKGYQANPNLAPDLRSAVSAEDGQHKFCPQCGRPFDKGDRFCRECGTPRR